MIEKNKIIALDADGVLVNFPIMFEDALRVVFKKEFPKAFQRETGWVDSWDLTIQYGISKKDLKKTWNYIYDNDKYLETPFYDGVEEKVLNIIENGYKVIIVTSINERASRARIQQFKTLSSEIDVYCVGLDGNKQGILEKTNPLVFVDDRYQNIQSALSSNITNIFWINDGFFHKETVSDKVKQFSNFNEVYKHMKDELNLLTEENKSKIGF